MKYFEQKLSDNHTPKVSALDISKNTLSPTDKFIDLYSCISSLSEVRFELGPPLIILFRPFIISSIFEKPITPVPNGDGGESVFSLMSFLSDREAITYGAPSGAASIRTTTNSFFNKVMV